jgi:hypothetical protein
MLLRRTALAVLLVALLTAAGSQEKSAEVPAPPKKTFIPEIYINLQVLPKDIKKPDLIVIMKSFALTMNVRCSHCHVATDDLSSADFPNDEKPTKAAARKMLGAILEVQRKYPAAPPAKP